MAESLVLAAGAEPIAGYKLVRLLGRGGFGEVWEASAPGDFHVALKFLRLGTSEAGAEEKSLDVIRSIRHPHLLDVQFATRVADCLMIAMPLCDMSLMDRFEDCRRQGLSGVPRDELLEYMDEIARAVDFLNEPRHRAGESGGGLVGVQHRDIKPHNIFLVGGSVRLADFGLARILAVTAASTKGSMSPSYAAPEVIQGKFSKWSDQYSLAATYCELRTGRPPFVGENPFAIIYAHVHTEPDLSLLPEGERPVLARALAKRPEERWPTCRSLVGALIDVAREDDRRASAPDRHPAGPSAVGGTKLLETPTPAPIADDRLEVAKRVPAAPSPEARKSITSSIGMRFVLIPAGSFEMGSPHSDRHALDGEKPQHHIRITRPFYLGTHEVTRRQYRAVTGENPGVNKESDDLPMGNVSWFEAVEFCNELSLTDGLTPFYRISGQRVDVPDWNGTGYRLPTEAEWEYACRAESMTKYSFGDDASSLDEFAWYVANSGLGLHPVGQKEPNAFGLYDMHGNAWEWCWDGYESTYYRQSPGADPVGPVQANSRVYRGGSSDSFPQFARSAFRRGLAPVDRFDILGFRVARVHSAE